MRHHFNNYDQYFLSLRNFTLPLSIWLIKLLCFKNFWKYPNFIYNGFLEIEDLFQRLEF